MAIQQPTNSDVPTMTEIIPPMLSPPAIMIGVLMFVTYLPESFMWLPRYFGFAR